MPSATELAWAAGIFEGEGSVRIDRPNARQRATLYVQVCNTDAEIVTFFQELWPAYVKRVGGTGVGTRRQAWAWVAAARKAAAFRLAELQTGSPFELRVVWVGAHERPYELEAELHRRFAEYRVQGEWFERRGVLAFWLDLAADVVDRYLSSVVV